MQHSSPLSFNRVSYYFCFPEGFELKIWMAIADLNRRHDNLVTALFQEGFLDEQFTQLQHLQDESNPYFVHEVISLYFEDSLKTLNSLQNSLNEEPVDYRKVDSCLHHFKGSSASIGAQRVKNVCIIFRVYCEGKIKNGCLQCLQELKEEYYLLKHKLEILLELEQSILASGGTISVTE